MAGKLLDLGIPASTRAGRIDALSAQFMAPEQLLQGYGARSSISGGSACSNVYSVGAVLYYLCTGGVPYPARTVRELVALREAGKALRPARINPSIPAPLNAIMLRSLATSASERYPSVSELAEALAFSLPNGQPRPEDGPQGRSSRHSAETLDSFDDIPTGQVILPPGGLPDDLSSLEDSQAEHTPVTGSAGMPRASAPAPKGSFSSHPAPPTASVSTPPAAGSLPPPPPAERPPGPSMDAREPSPTRTSGLPPLGHSHSGIAPRPRPEPPGAPGESASRPSRPPSVLRQTQRPVPEPAAHRETAGQTQPPAAGIPPLPPTPSRSAPPPPPPSVPPPVLPPASPFARPPGVTGQEPERPVALGGVVTGGAAAVQGPPSERIELSVAVIDEDEQTVPTVVPSLDTLGQYTAFEDLSPRSRLLQQVSPRVVAAVLVAMVAMAAMATLWYVWPTSGPTPPSTSEPTSGSSSKSTAQAAADTPTGQGSGDDLGPRAPSPEPHAVAPSQGSTPPAVAPTATSESAQSQLGVTPVKDAKAEPLVERAPVRASPARRRGVVRRRAPRARRPRSTVSRSALAPEGEGPSTSEGADTGEDVDDDPLAVVDAPAAAGPPGARSSDTRAPFANSAVPSPGAVVYGIEVDRRTTQDKPKQSATSTAPLRARARIAGLEVQGSLATSVVRRALARGVSDYAACYRTAATRARKNAFGQVQVSFDIDLRGRIRHVRTGTSGLPGLAACVGKVTSRLATNRQPDTGTVKASFEVAFFP